MLKASQFLSAASKARTCYGSRGAIAHRSQQRHRGYARGTTSGMVSPIQETQDYHPGLHAQFSFPSRSWLFCAKSMRAFEKANKLGADVAVLDLEDSVAPDRKAEMRKEYKAALDKGVFTRPNMKILVRVSGTECMDEMAKDVQALARPGIHGFILPKAETCEDIYVLNEMLGESEVLNGAKEGSMKIVPLVETPRAFFHLEELTMSSPRIAAIIAGNADLSTMTMCDPESVTVDTYFSNTALAARAANIVCIGGVHIMLDNATEFESFCLKLKNCGFDGALTLTPKQVTIANNVFAHSARELKWASMVLDDTNRGAQQIHTIRRSIQESREMIGPPYRKKAAAILQRNKKMEETLGVRTSDTPRLQPVEAHRWLSQELHVGKMISSPLEITITDSWKGLWDSAFLSLSTLPNSSRKAATLGLPNVPLPFSLLAALQAGFTVAVFTYDARVHLGFFNMFQYRGVFPGDTLRAAYCVDSSQNRLAGDGNLYTIVTTTHWLFNQDNLVVFQAQKKTMFAPRRIHGGMADTSITHQKLHPDKSIWKATILEQPTERLVSQTPAYDLSPEQLLVHEVTKIHNFSEMRMLAYLLRVINPHHHDKIRYSSSDILVPGPFVMAATMSNASQSLGDVLYEEICESTNLNKVNAGDQISTITYIVDSQPLEEKSDLEEVTIRHLGIKNTDLSILLETGIPHSLFSGQFSKPSEFETLCRQECPQLYHKIACNIKRKVIRVRPVVAATYQQMKETIPEEILLR